MAGRAGRLGYSSSGEAILMIKDSALEKRLAARLCLGEVDPLLSSLHAGYGGGVEKLLLDMVCCRRLERTEQVHPFMAHTLMNAQHPIELVAKRTEEALCFLVQHQFVTRSGQDGNILSPTQKGCASAYSGISPFDVDEVIKWP
jgi:replicative superfamily II helicase